MIDMRNEYSHFKPTPQLKEELHTCWKGCPCQKEQPATEEEKDLAYKINAFVCPRSKSSRDGCYECQENTLKLLRAYVQKEVEKAYEKGICDAMNHRIPSGVHADCDACVDKTAISVDDINKIEQQAVEKALKAAEASLAQQRAKIMEEGASLAMGELKIRLTAANSIGCEWVLEYINTRYPNASKQPKEGKGKEGRE